MGIDHHPITPLAPPLAKGGRTMKIRDLLPFNWKKETARKESQLPQQTDSHFRSFDSVSSDLDTIFDRSFRNFGLTVPDSGHIGNPKINISETKKELKFEAELPGMDEKDIKVTIENGYISLRGERKHEFTDEKTHRVECSYGYFERSLPLPDYAIADKAKANYKKGILTISVPKDTKKETAKSIPISVG